jgi:hypothetical protein
VALGSRKFSRQWKNVPRSQANSTFETSLVYKSSFEPFISFEYSTSQ